MEAVLMSTDKRRHFLKSVDNTLEAVLRSSLASNTYAKKNEKG